MALINVWSEIFPPSPGFTPEENSLSQVNLPSLPDSPPLPPAIPPNLPPPLPTKSRDLLARESPSPSLSQPEDRPSDPPPARNSTTRVSFREPISCSYSVDEEEDEEEDDEEQPEGEEDPPDEEEMNGGFGSRLRLQKGIPPQMDLLGKKIQYFGLNFCFWKGGEITELNIDQINQYLNEYFQKLWHETRE